MSLKEHLDFLSHEIAFWALGIDDPKYPIGQLGSLSENLSYQLRSLAIITLLIEGDTNLFYHNLIRSGLVREAFLKRCQTEKYKDYYCAISRSGAFFDTVAAGDFDLAKRIAKLSPDGWISDGEYEDDYCFAKFFQLIIRPNTSQETLNTLLEKFETSLEGDISSNIELCQAFMDSDQSIFDEAFNGLIEQHDAHLMAEKERGQMEDAHILAQRQIYVEGLAILRVAERIGLKTQSEYKFCPLLARLPITIPQPKTFP